MTEDKSKSLTIPQNNSLARVEKSIALTNKLLSTIDETVTDIDGNVYKTVKIGNQVWMAENLKVTHYRNGDPITNITDNSQWGDLSDGAYGDYNNDPSNSDTYGRLYNFYVVDDARGLCPKGWHVPSDEEWMELEMYLGMSYEEAHSNDIRGTNQGSQLAGNIDFWDSGDLENDTAFGSSGFLALPGGNRSIVNGSYYGMGNSSCFWSSTPNNSLYARDRALHNVFSDVFRGSYNKRLGYSVRCVRDAD
jgi:uncharacterized protein (TIGR02145 family)